MKFFKALKEYFGSKERVQLEQEDVLVGCPHNKVFKTVTHIGNDTIVVMPNGDVYSAEDPDNYIFTAVKVCLTEKQVKALFIPEKDTKEQVIGRKDLKIFQDNTDFQVVGDKVFLSGTNVPIVEDVLAEFIEILEKQQEINRESTIKPNPLDVDEFIKLTDKYNRLIFFWLKLANSPVKDINNVLLFCKENDVRLSKTGNIIAYRRVNKYKVVTEEDRRWEFVSSWYEKIKKKWKKNPNNYLVNKVNGQYTISKVKETYTGTGSFEGFLGDLFLAGNTSKGEQLYTSYHNAGRYKFPIPSLYKMEGEEPNPDLSNCASNGIHCASVSYDYSGFGNTPVVVLVNPLHAIHTPTRETGKFRTSEMYIVGINPNDHGVHISDDFIKEADEIYNQISIDQLKEALETKNLSDLSAMEYVPTTSLKDISEITKILENRTINI